jgi:hypothetical protein
MNLHAMPLKPLYMKAYSGFRTLFFGEKSNYDFGTAEILMEYSNVSLEKKMRGRYQHGWYILPKKEFWINDYLPTYVWSKFMLEFAHSRGFHNFVAIGSSWLYFLELLKNRGLYDLTELRKGNLEELWVYGGHSTDSYSADSERLLEFLKCVRESQSPSKLLLLYDLDYQRISSIINVQDLGVGVVSIGPRNSSFYSKAHFFNLFHILTDSQLVVTNYPTSIVCYALSLGKDVRWHKDDDFNDASLSVDLYGSESLIEMMQLEIIPAIAYRPQALRELGSESLKSPEELRSLLLWNRGTRRRVRVLLFLAKNTFKLIYKIFLKPRGLGIWRK